ncbi:MAG: DMT family transporter [Acidimicrobiales bacterium]|mgnify:FL=1|jgi:drug/metabolite transporter (DMT)-like permease|nr:DMT family transporter [Acidimicrobiales bacterium]MDP6298076.1 DMT family transporter [Acidimicrobiales bacterium]HJM28437.1 DMT family transporter [Acidimicrobiales bacterium]HJM97637.1 DMT family transporter [Acidimicrobiales bacterium]
MSEPEKSKIVNDSKIALIGAALAVTAWGSSGVIVKYITVSSTEIAVYRFTFYAILMMLFLKVRGTPLTFKALRTSLWGGIALGLNVAFFFESLKRTTVVNATIIGSLQPVLISIYSYRTFGEKIRRKDVIVGIIALLGTFGVVAGSSGTAEWDITGDLLAVAALFTWAAYFIVSKKTQDLVTPLEFTAASGVITGVLNFGIALIFGVSFTIPSNKDIFWIIVLATVAGLIGHSLMNWSLVRIPLWVGSSLNLFIPVVSAFLAWMFLDESLNFIQILSTFVVVSSLGVIMVDQD